MSKGDIRVVELFAGVGGFRLGLERSSPQFKTIWANQWEPGKVKQHAFDCYVEHFGTSSNHVNGDIAIEKNNIPEHDLLVGGFPCQDYSVATTKAEGIVGKKGVLWWSINDIIADKRPPYVLLENVDRLIRSPSSQRGRDFAIILRCLMDKGYIVEWRVINAADYGEVQKRRRTFIFAYHENSSFFKSIYREAPEVIVGARGFFAKGFPTKGPKEDRVHSFSIGSNKYKTLVDLSESFSNLFYKGGVAIDGQIYTRECPPDYSGPWIYLGNILSKNVDEKYFVKDVEKWKFMKGSKKIERTDKKTGFKYLYSEGQIPFPDKLDAPGRTLLTSEGSTNRSSHIVEDRGHYRILTPEECERMNGFDVSWTDTGMPESARYFTMGNALVVPLIEKMGNTFKDII